MSQAPSYQDADDRFLAAVDSQPTIQLQRGDIDPITLRRVTQRTISPTQRASIQLAALTALVLVLLYLVLGAP